MKRNRRPGSSLLGACLACTLLCAGCIPGDSAQNLRPAGTGNTTYYSGLLENASIAVDIGAGTVVGDTASYFGRQLAAITSHTERMEVMAVADPLESLQKGEVQFALLDAARYQEGNPDLAALCEPFRYESYTGFVMAVNDAAVLSQINASSGRREGFVAVSAYYQGSHHLLASWHLYDWQPGAGIPVAVSPATQTGRVLELMGAQPMEERSPRLRLELLQEGEAEVAEFTLKELSALDLSEVPRYLNLTFHTAAPMLLVTQWDFHQSLTAAEQAAIQEASAYLHAYLEPSMVEEEQLITDSIEALDFEVEEEFEELREQVRTAWRNRSGIRGDRYLQNLLDNAS